MKNSSTIAYRSLSLSDVDDQARAACYGDWRQSYEQLSCGQYLGKMEDLRLPGLTVMREGNNRITFESGSVARESYAIGVPVRMNGTGWFCGNELHENCITLLKPDKHFEMRTSEVFQIVGGFFDPNLLVDFLQTQSVVPEELSFDLSRLPSVFQSSFSAELVEFMTGLLETASQDASVFGLENIQKQVVDEFLDIACSIINFGSNDSSSEIYPARERLVKRLRNYIDNSDEEVITVADVCNQLGVTRRTLQNTLIQVMGIPPKSYFVAKRLNGVRRDLKDRSKLGQTITEIAYRWGFWHLSKFAVNYNRFFGELPSATRRSQIARNCGTVTNKM